MNAIDAYLDHLRVERRLSPNTLESYAHSLASLARFSERRSSAIETLDRSALEAFVREQRETLSPRSVARVVASVRGFFRYLVLDGRLEHNPAEDLHPPRVWAALPKFLSLDEVETLIGHPDTST